MQLDAIGKQIKIDNLTEVLENLSYQGYERVEVLTDQRQFLGSDPVLANSYYLSQNRHSVTLATNTNLGLTELKLELTLLNKVLRSQVAKKALCFPFNQASKKHHGKQPGSEILLVLPEKLFKILYTSKFKETKIDYLQFRNQVYLKLAQQLVDKRAFFTYLFGATPFSWQDGIDEELVSPRRSVSNSLNEVELKEANALNYRNLADYLASKATTTTSDNVNLKVIEIDGQKTIEGLIISGIDFNPLNESLVDGLALDFLDICLGYFLMTEGLGADELALTLANSRALNQTVASENPFAKTVIFTELRKFLEQLNHFANTYYYPNWQKTYTKLKQRLDEPKATLSAKVLRAQGEADSLYSLALKAGLPMEKAKVLLSANLKTMITTAILNKRHFRLLSQDLELVQIEEKILKAGLKTKDNSALLEEMWSDKQVSKQLVSAAGFDTLTAWKVTNIQDLALLEPKIAEKALAIKSATDLAAKASRLFRLPPSKNQLKASVQAVLKEQKQALIEQVVPGSTYKALIIQGKLLSLVERIPASVVGNGRQTLKELIAAKNLKLGQVERETLASQGLNLNEVVARGIQVLLRYDATSYTGASQVESLSELDSTYITTIEKIAQVLGMSEGQLDLIIPNIYQAYQQKPGQLYFLGAHKQIDLSFHLDVMMDQNQSLPKQILDKLLSSK